MFNLLPTLQELVPIIDDRNTFVCSNFNREFVNLNFEEQFQIATDLVRQAILIKNYPNPDTELKTLIGDSYTAAMVLIRYMQELRIGKNCRIVIAYGTGCDTENITESRFLVLADDEQNTTYSADCSTYPGYGCGKVRKLSDIHYDEYVIVDRCLRETLYGIRKMLYYYYNVFVSSKESEIVFWDSLKCSIPHRYRKALACLFGYNMHTLASAKEIDFWRRSTNRQIENWNEELLDLIFEDRNYLRQIELGQAIIHERIKIAPDLKKYFYLVDKKISYESITPRFFFENKLTLVMIKPSAYMLGVQNTVRERFLKRGYGAFSEVMFNMGKPTETGIGRMRLFHPHGYMYENPMYGPCDMFLVKDSSENVLIKKRELRKSLGRNVNNLVSTWYNGEKVTWGPINTNFVHSTDNPSETCLHFGIIYPEHNIMTRFMYPNLKMQF